MCDFFCHECAKTSKDVTWIPPTAFSDEGKFYGMKQGPHTTSGGGYDPSTGAYMTFTYDDRKGGPYHRYTVSDGNSSSDNDDSLITRGVAIDSDDSDDRPLRYLRGVAIDSDDSDDRPLKYRTPIRDDDQDDFLLQPSASPWESETEDNTGENEEENEQNKDTDERKNKALKKLRKTVFQKMKNKKAGKHAAWVSHELDLLQQYENLITMALLYSKPGKKSICKCFVFQKLTTWD